MSKTERVNSFIMRLRPPLPSISFDYAINLTISLGLSWTLLHKIMVFLSYEFKLEITAHTDSNILCLIIARNNLITKVPEDSWIILRVFIGNQCWVQTYECLSPSGGREKKGANGYYISHQCTNKRTQKAISSSLRINSQTQDFPDLKIFFSFL